MSSKQDFRIKRMLHHLELRFLQSIRHLFKNGQTIPARIAISLSGGLDSMCLTHLLHKVNQHENLGIQIHTISMDHGLRDKSSQEINFIGEEIKKLGLYETFHNSKLNLAELKPEDSFEEVARVQRYNTLHSICQNFEIHHLMTGHHFDDNLETFVLRLFGNSGIMGLRGIQRKSIAPSPQSPNESMHRLNLIRPLLDFTKMELYTYAKENNIKWVEDHTNGLEITKRNTVRSYLRQNPSKQHELVEVYNQVLNFTDMIERRVDQVYHTLRSEQKIDFSARGLRIQFDNKTLDENSNLVIAVLLFKLFYPYSPSSNYHYSFHKVLKTIPALKSQKQFTLLQLKWNLVHNENTTVLTIRKQNTPTPSSQNIIIPPLSHTKWFLFDNIYWFQFINPSSREQHFLLKSITIADKPARAKIGGKSLVEFEGTPFVYDLKDKNNSYFPVIENRKTNPWTLKNNIYSFDSY